MFRNHAAARELDSLKPEDAAKAREALLGDHRAGHRAIDAKAEAHRERARVMAELAPDILAFDDTPDGERLRRFDLASGRGLARSLGELRRHRREAVSGPSRQWSVVSCPLLIARLTRSQSEVRRTNPLMVRCQRSVVRPQLPVARVTRSSSQRRTNEPTAARENVTNEPTVAHENVTNEPTEACENVTNEPTVGPLSLVRCPLPVASCDVKADDLNEPTVVRENVANEATNGCGNTTNEPTLSDALRCAGSSWEGEPPCEPSADAGSGGASPSRAGGHTGRGMPGSDGASALPTSTSRLTSCGISRG